jgi:hypothetical protein
VVPDKIVNLVKQLVDHRIKARETEIASMKNLFLQAEQLELGAEHPSPVVQVGSKTGGKPFAVKKLKTGAKGVGTLDLKQPPIKRSLKMAKQNDYSIKITATLEPATVKLLDQECFDRRLRGESPTYTEIIRVALGKFFKAKAKAKGQLSK